MMVACIDLASPSSEIIEAKVYGYCLTFFEEFASEFHHGVAQRWKVIVCYGNNHNSCRPAKESLKCGGGKCRTGCACTAQAQAQALARHTKDGNIGSYKGEVSSTQFCSSDVDVRIKLGLTNNTLHYARNRSLARDEDSLFHSLMCSTEAIFSHLLLCLTLLF
ncbi:unnamed protein product [Clavelina lepadiformis]|uniref:Uncharacterized protein n=1 Tax=Clavelina lepadiformis TaxID=159417 RepID=A0ABP0F3H7_CLALP